MMPVEGSGVECCVRVLLYVYSNTDPIFVIRIRSSLERHENPACNTLLGVLELEKVFLLLCHVGHCGPSSLERLKCRVVLCQFKCCSARLVFRVDVRPCAQEPGPAHDARCSEVECCVRAPIFVIRIRSSLERHENPVC